MENSAASSLAVVGMFVAPNVTAYVRAESDYENAIDPFNG